MNRLQLVTYSCETAFGYVLHMRLWTPRVGTPPCLIVLTGFSQRFSLIRWGSVIEELFTSDLTAVNLLKMYLVILHGIKTLDKIELSIIEALLFNLLSQMTIYAQDITALTTRLLFTSARQFSLKYPTLKHGWLQCDITHRSPLHNTSNTATSSPGVKMSRRQTGDVTGLWRSAPDTSEEESSLSG